ncbi:MAG: twin-arginine translocase subunit TatC [Candidatus Heimdallarchaeota archaeon]|nr:twin-arginine translocase subunit TatC [Candidatus Heimdallarchaeota archaeon]
MAFKPNWMKEGEKNLANAPEKLRESLERTVPSLKNPGGINFSATSDAQSKIISAEPMELSDHVIELYKLLRKVVRNIFICSVLVFILPGIEDGNLALYPFKPLVLQVLNVVIHHIFNSFDMQSVEIYIGSPLTPISMYINLGVFMGTLIALPLTLKQIMDFVTPGLTPKEIETLFSIGKNAIILFLVGVGISYFFILPNTFRILGVSGGIVGEATLLQMYSLQSVINLMLWGTLGGGLLYASPLLLVALVNLDILETQQIANRRREILMVVFIFAAFITPDPTIVSMVILSIPMIVIVELMITMGYRIELKKLIEGDLLL